MTEREDDVRLSTVPDLRPPRRSTAISQLLTALKDELEGGDAPTAGRPAFPYRVRIASDRVTRERAFGLAWRVYRQQGYAGSENKMCVSPFDLLAQTLTLLAEDADGREVATASLIVDSPFGLPCDEIFGSSANDLRRQDRQLAEVTRLAICPKHRGSRELLVELFMLLYAYARHSSGADDFVVEVNPRHVPYYCRLLNFEILGPERPCPRVNGAPAVLLRLDLLRAEHTKEQMEKDPLLTHVPEARTLLRFFPTCLEMKERALDIERQHRSVSPSEARSYRLTHGKTTCCVGGR